MSDSSWPGGERLPFPSFPGRPRALSPRLLAAAEPILQVAGIGAWYYREGGDLWWSAETRRIHGVPAGFTPDLTSAIAFYLPEHRPVIAAAVEEALRTGRPWDVELCICRADGERRQVRARGRPADGASRALIGTFEDITARHEAAARAARELELRTRTETLLRDVIAGIPAALSVYDGDERLILVNDEYRDLLPGNRQFMVKGERLADIISRKVLANHYVPEVRASDPPEVRQAWVADYLRRHRTPGYNRVFHLRDDKFMQASTAISESGNIVSIRTDVTPLMRAERELRRRAEEDALTGLANRDVLMQQLEQLPVAGSPGPGGVLVLLDVDFFKAVNDSLGHAAGDTLLRLIGRRLQRSIRADDTAARLSGDEFALIVHGLPAPADIQAFALRMLARLRRPMRLGANRYAPSLSVGIAPFPATGCGPRELLANADAALLEAKRQGRGRHVLFGAELAEQVTRRSRLADALRQALARPEIRAALQPQQRLVDGHVQGFEALARWWHDGAWVPPTEFVALAEDVGLAQPLGHHVMEAALAGFAAMLAAGLEPGHLAINVTTAQLLADDFVDTVRRSLARHGVPPQRLEIEVTETVLLDRSIARIGQTLEALRAMGCTLAMDDFGTGYASLSHLTTFPVDRIKVDRSFTGAIDRDGDRGLIARTLIQLGRGLGLGVIAEGVETTSQRSFLQAHGCMAIQGFLVARPMLPDEALAWLATHEGQHGKPCSASVARRRRRPAV